ncbi:MAG: cobalt-precorrin-5B (C(1))-methyltransferase [Azospirillaceae bacterium]
MTRRPSGPLRRGWTTGACATAATKAAATALLTGAFPDPVSIVLPKGEAPAFALARSDVGADSARASVIKDAGDDPDVTHGAEIMATVRRASPGAGIVFRAGEGVGTITRPGLPLPPGEPAINPVPRRLMTEVLTALAAEHGIPADFEVEVAVTGGAALAEKTWNPRLGIVGGLSILGTTGVVQPYSCAAWIHSIHRGIDVARANGFAHVAACTGSTSEAGVAARHDLPPEAYLDMGDFAGGLLKYLAKHPVPRLTLAGGFGKLSKLAAGYLDLHSGRSQVDLADLAERARGLGADAATVSRIAKAGMAGEALEIATAAGVALADAVAAGAREVAAGLLGPDIAVEVLIFDRRGGLIGRAAPDAPDALLVGRPAVDA